jgi:hypothetical protein
MSRTFLLTVLSIVALVTVAAGVLVYVDGRLSRDTVVDQTLIRATLPAPLMVGMVPNIVSDDIGKVARYMSVDGFLRSDDVATQATVLAVAPNGSIARLLLSGESRNDIEIVDASGERVAHLVVPEDTSRVYVASWSPDSSSIAYQVNHYRGNDEADMTLNRQDVIINNLDTAKETVIQNASAPVFLTDGSLLYFDTSGRVVRKETHASTPTVVIDDAAEDLGKHDFMIATPDGQYVVVSRPNRSEVIVYVKGASGVTYTESKRESSVMYSPILTPDKKGLYYVTRNASQGALGAISYFDIVTGTSAITFPLPIPRFHYAVLAWGS